MLAKSRSAVVEKYGPIDYASRRWPDRDKHMGMLEVPAGWFPNWYVLDTKIPVRHIYINKDAHAPLLHALQSVHALKLGDQLRTFNGAFNIRAVRGGAAFSMHSYGLAIDIAAKWNPMQWVKHPWQMRTSFTPEFVRCFTEQGWYWGGNWKSKKDPMHFSLGFPA